MNWSAPAQATGEATAEPLSCHCVGCTARIAHPGRSAVYTKFPDELAVVSNF